MCEVWENENLAGIRRDMKKVAILMSTYNGDAYIEEQLKSIYAQEYPNFILYIRDDGSKAEFIEKLEELQKQYGFILYKGENIGFLESFYWLLREVDNADFYSFADQDDIWYPEKIGKAVTWLAVNENKTPQLPLLYHCTYEIRNADGEVVEHFYFPENNYDFRRSLTENHYSGFAMVINRKMRECMLLGDVKQLDYHDWWAANIAHGFGKSYFDKYVGAAHCAHENNVTKITFGRKLKWLFRSLKQEAAIHKRAVEFQRLFSKELSLEDQKVLNLFVDKKYHLGHALKKCFYSKRWRPNISSEITMRFLMLVGKI